MDEKQNGHGHLTGPLRPGGPSLRALTFLVPGIPLEFFQIVTTHLARSLGCQIQLEAESRVSGPMHGDSDPFAEDRADIGFLCSPSYLYLRSQRRPSIRLVPAGFVFRDERAGGEAVYFSDVVVRADHHSQEFEDLAGSTWGYNDECSLSGYFATMQKLAEIGCSGSYFERTVHTGSHDASIEAILSGDIDGAAIDSTVLSRVRRERRELETGLRILDSGGPSPSSRSSCAASSAKSGPRASPMRCSSCSRCSGIPGSLTSASTVAFRSTTRPTRKSAGPLPPSAKSPMPTEVGTIEAIYRYPVKSMRGERLEAADLGWHGIRGDRRLAFRRVDARGGNPWLSAGRLPDLISFSPLRREGDRDDLPSHARTPEGEELPLFGEALAAEVGRRHGAAVQMMQLGHGIFDEASVSVIASSTVREIGRLAERDVDARRFRPNLFVRSTRDAPFEEDEWVGGVLTFGDAGGCPRRRRHDARPSLCDDQPRPRRRQPPPPK